MRVRIERQDVTRFLDRRKRIATEDFHRHAAGKMRQIELDVEMLALDSTSFRQLVESSGRAVRTAAVQYSTLRKVYVPRADLVNTTVSGLKTTQYMRAR